MHNDISLQTIDPVGNYGNEKLQNQEEYRLWLKKFKPQKMRHSSEQKSILDLFKEQVS